MQSQQSIICNIRNSAKNGSRENTCKIQNRSSCPLLSMTEANVFSTFNAIKNSQSVLSKLHWQHSKYAGQQSEY